MSLFPVKRNRVFFISFYGKSYSDNPKAISEALHQMYGDKFEYIWVVSKQADLSFFPKYVKLCRYNTLQMLFYMSTSKVWVSNFCLSRGTFKKNNQFYIQTWHGDRGFKKILNDVPSKVAYRFETDHADLMTAGSEFAEEYVCRGAFNYKGPVLTVGSPRNDKFFKNDLDIKQRVRERYHLKSNEKLVMYAPTFRNQFKEQKQRVTLDLHRVLDSLHIATGETWKMLLRSHSAGSKQGLDVSLDETMVLVTDYPDMNELLLVTDVLITDYSSSIGDFCLSGKLCLLFQDDIEEYLNNDREFCFKIEDSPYFRFYEPEKLYDFLLTYKTVDAKSNCKAIYDFYRGRETGTASNEVAKIIYEKCCI